MTKTVKKVLLFLFVLVSYQFNAQRIESKNTVYFEGMGKGFFYSLNYERNLYEFNDNLSVQSSIGFCLMPGFTDIEPSTDFTMPLELNLRYGLAEGIHNIVAGYGTTYWRYFLYDIPINRGNVDQQPIQPVLRKTKEWFAHLVLEYRYQKPEGGLIAKAGYTPLFFAQMSNFAYQKKSNFAHSFNFGIGYSF